MSIRAFLAVNFSVPATRRLAEAAGEVRAQVKAPADSETALKTSWVPPANLHVTLRFLGDIAEELAPRLVIALKQSLHAFDPFEIKAGGLGAFPSLEAPRVLWLGVDGGKSLVKLQGEIERTLGELGFPKDERPFFPHVTIGRIVEGSWAAAPTLDKPEIATSRISEVVLYESRPVQKAQEYVALGRVGFGALARAAS